MDSQAKKKNIKLSQLNRLSSDWDELCSRHRKLMKRCPVGGQQRCTEEVRRAVRHKTVDLLGHGLEEFLKLDYKNYVRVLATLLLAEQHHESIEMRKHDQLLKYVKVVKRDFCGRVQLAQLTLNGLSKGQPSLIPSDFVVLHTSHGFDVWRITQIRGDLISFEPVNSWRPSGGHFDVSFVASGYIYEKYHSSLDQAARLNIRQMLFECPISDNGCRPLAKINIDATSDDMLEERLMSCNASQRRAIIGILEAKCRPKPYILFGPPGTGKTFTVVESVVQIHRRQPYCRILVCANSNNCADQLAAAVHATKLAPSMVRLCAQGGLREKQKPSSYHVDRFELYSMATCNVVVTTNNMSWAFGGDKFNYVIVDEAGHAHEPETLLPANCLAHGGCLVLAGDPKQLGPVVHCKQVEELGLGQSMLERLFGLSVYGRHPQEGYNARYITQLTDCYRCDPRILVPCNKLFYERELNCLGHTPEALLKKLKLSHPLVFCPVGGREKKISTSTSRCNPLEAHQCVKLVIKLLKLGLKPKQIGVISFYTLQVEEINERLKSALKFELPQIIEGLKHMEKDLEYLEASEIVIKEEEEQESDEEKKEGADESSGEESLDELVVEGNDLDLRELIESRTRDAESEARHRENKRRRKEHERRKRERELLRRWLCQVDTVDGFQGKEKEVVIISTVRCSSDSPDSHDSINKCGFLADSKRFNVAISRAKWLTMVVGHPAVVNCHENWREFNRNALQYDQ